MIPGQRIRIPKWIHGHAVVARVEVEAIIPDEDPSEPCLELPALRWLDELQQLADDGKIDELAKHGEVYVRRAG
jgi:hypothetical protein